MSVLQLQAHLYRKRLTLMMRIVQELPHFAAMTKETLPRSRIKSWFAACYTLIWIPIRSPLRRCPTPTDTVLTEVLGLKYPPLQQCMRLQSRSSQAMSTCIGWDSKTHLSQQKNSLQSRIWEEKLPMPSPHSILLIAWIHLMLPWIIMFSLSCTNCNSRKRDKREKLTLVLEQPATKAEESRCEEEREDRRRQGRGRASHQTEQPCLRTRCYDDIYRKDCEVWREH